MAESRRFLASRLGRRTATLYFILSLVGAALYSGFLIFLFNVTFERLLDGEIANDALVFQAAYAQGGLGAVQPILPRQEGGLESVYAVAVADRAGRILAGNFSAWPAGIPVGPYHDWLDTHGLIDFWQDVLLHVEPMGASHYLLIARSTESMQEEIEAILLGLFLLGLSLPLAAAWAGYGLARQPMRRVEALESLTRQVAQGSFNLRAATLAQGDEIDALARSINGMLDSQQAALERVRMAGDALAHDMRTPLARLKLRLDALARKYPNDEGLTGIAQDLDESVRLLASLLRLGRIEEGRETLTRRTLFARDYLSNIVELFEPAATDKGVRIALDVEDAAIEADPDLLAQALSNILENAIRHAPPNSVIALGAQGSANAMTIEIKDQGPGLTDADLGRAFDRFWRGENSRAAPGYGLGLPLARAIARLHGGDLELRNGPAPWGLRVLFRMPRG